MNEPTQDDLMERHNELLSKVHDLFDKEGVSLSEATDIGVAILRNVRMCMQGDIDVFWASVAGNAANAEKIVVENEAKRKKMS